MIECEYAILYAVATIVVICACFGMNLDRDKRDAYLLISWQIISITDMRLAVL